MTENTVILGEAKWRSSVGRGQGAGKDKDQIQLRMEFLEKHAARIFRNASLRAVVGVGPAKTSFTSFERPDSAGVAFRSTTWRDVCSLESHPLRDEVRRYYATGTGLSRSLTVLAHKSCS
jgi:hypothetical protein